MAKVGKSAAYNFFSLVGLLSTIGASDDWRRPIPTRWSWELRVLELVKIARKVLAGFFTNSIFVFGLQNLNRGVGPAPFELG